MHTIIRRGKTSHPLTAVFIKLICEILNKQLSHIQSAVTELLHLTNMGQVRSGYRGWKRTEATLAEFKIESVEPVWENCCFFKGTTESLSFRLHFYYCVC